MGLLWAFLYYVEENVIALRESIFRHFTMFNERINIIFIETKGILSIFKKKKKKCSNFTRVLIVCEMSNEINAIYLWAHFKKQGNYILFEKKFNISIFSLMF